MKDFKKGYATAIAVVIHNLTLSYAPDCVPPGSGEVLPLPSELTDAYRGKGWSYDELVDAGVEDVYLGTLKAHAKQLGW